MKTLKGKKEAEKILQDLKRRIKKEKLSPKLAVISVGKDPASQLFIKNKKKAAQRIGVRLAHFQFAGAIREEKIIKKIELLNKNNNINGIIVQIPLPKKIKAEKIVSQISCKKDVDGFSEKSEFSSPLISTIIMVLKKNLRNKKHQKRIIALVNSDIFGTTLKEKMKKENIKADYILRKKNSLIKIKEKTKKADVIITVLGRPGFVKSDMIKKGAALIDCGITLTKNKKIKGDVDKETIGERADFLTPVPGGIGPLTIAFLLKNVYLAAKK